MTKEELQLKVQNLETLLTSKEEETTTLNTQLSQAKKVLADISKPKITKETVDQIRTNIDEALQNYSFNDMDNYEYDFEIDYDSRLTLSNIELNNTDELAEMLSDYVEDIFNVISDED
jgi:NH3-dependent NAD+ synthetase